MADNNISIIIQAKDDATATLKEVSRTIQQTGESADNAEPKTDRFGSTLGTLGSRIRFVAETFAIYRVGQALTDFASSSVAASGQLEQTNMSFQSLIGNVKQANQLFGELTQYANVTPFQSKDVTDAAKQLLAFGQDAGQVVDTVKKLGDVTSAGGGDLQALSLVTGQIFAQGKLRAQDMYQVINDGGAGLVKIMAQNAGGMQKLTDEFNAGGIPAQQYFDAINQATGKGGFAFEGAQKQADTFNGRLSTLKDSATQFGEALIGVHTDPQLGLQVEPGGLFDRMKTGIKDVSDALSGWQPAAQQIIPQLFASLQRLWDRVSAFLGPSFKALGHTLKDEVFPVLDKLWHKVIEPLIPVLGTALVLAIKLTVDTLNALLRIVTPVVNFLIDHKQAVIDFALAFGTLALYMKFDDIKASFLGNMDNIMGKIGNVKGGVSDLFTKISGGTTMGAIGVAGALADIALVAQAVQSAVDAIHAMNDTAKGATVDAQGQTAAEKSVIASYKAGTISKAEETRILQFMAQPQHALGTNFASTDSYVAGEAGPELITNARGSKVTPARQTAQMLASRGNTVHIGNLNINSDMDLRRIIRDIGWRLQTA